MNNRLQPLKNRLVPHPGAAIAILFGTFFFFMCILSLVVPFLTPRFSNPMIAGRIMTLIQSLLVFMIPALITAVTATRLPATLLAIDRNPKLVPSLLIIVIIALAAPAMNCIIEWNENIHLPESLSSLETTLRQMEDNAQNFVTDIMGAPTIGSLIVSIMIIGVMAGLCEELFFRGAFQRTLCSTRLNTQVAVWVAAIVFSFMHFQFFGFIPRILLGAFFGYILLWGGNLWYSIIAHAANNTIAVVAMWHSNATNGTLDLNTIGQSTDTTLPQLPLIIASLVATTLGIIVLKKQLKKTE